MIEDQPTGISRTCAVSDQAYLVRRRADYLWIVPTVLNEAAKVQQRIGQEVSDIINRVLDQTISI